MMIRCLVACMLLLHISIFALLLGANPPETPRSAKERIGARVASFLPPSNAAHESVLLGATLFVPVLMAMSMVIATDANRKLRAQIMRMGAMEDTGRDAVDTAHGAVCGAKVGIRELSGDALEQRLLTVQTDHGDIARSLEDIERTHLERMNRMGDRATILAKQIETTQERLAGIATGESTMSQTVSHLEAARRELDDCLKTTEGEADLAERLTEAAGGLEAFEPRIAAIEALKPRVIVARDTLTALTIRLEAANGGEKNYLNDIFATLKTDVDELDTEVTTAGQDENENELVDELRNIDLNDITIRIEALEDLLPKVLTAKQELEGLRSRLTIIASVDIDEEIGSLQRGIERLGKVLEPLEEGDADEQAQELDEIGTELPKLAERFEALKTKLAGA